MDDARPTGSTGSYRCGAIEIDSTQRRVLLNGVAAKIGARAFDILLALLERRDRVVSKRELMDVVWPRLVVEENNLLVHMVALRKLLGPQAIVTIPGRGYRFVLAVDKVIDERSKTSGAAAANVPDAATLRGNLPPAPDLFGRVEDLAAVDALIREHAVVTIVGAGGIGKTSLAQAVAAAAELEFPDGRWWAELAPVVEGAQVANSVAATLGLQLSSGRSPQESLVMALANKRLLLVLDSCEHLGEDVALFVDQLRIGARDVRLLLTSQESLKCHEEQVYRLGALSVPANAQLEEAVEFGAVALFVERAHAVEPRFRLDSENVAEVIEICRRLDGIPLAIELAAARVPLLGVHGLQTRLNQMFHVLTGGSRMKLRRHQTLRAALEWSHGLLSEDEQAAFRRLGVFAGGFTLELAQQVASDNHVDQWLVLDLLGRLIDKSLVIASGDPEPRYRLLETTRAFALEQLAASGESEAMLRRHARVMCEQMAATDANCWNLSPADRRRTAQELGNLRAAIDWTIAFPSDRPLAYALLGKCWLAWMHNGLVSEGMQRMLQLWPPPGDLPETLEADFCLAISRLHEGAGRDEEWQAVKRAVVLYRTLGDSERLGDALLLMATIGLERGCLQEAAEALREAETVVSATTPLRKQAALAATQGMYYGQAGALEMAIAAYRSQRELYRRAGAEFGQYLALGNLGSSQLDAGDVDGAIDSLRLSVEGLRRINAPYGQETRIGKLAVALALRGDDLDVIPLAREAFDSLRSLGVTFSAVMAAALQHARRNRLQHAVLLAAYARYTKEQKKQPFCPVDHRIVEFVKDRARTEFPAERVESWMRSGELLSEEQAAAIAFDDAPVDGLI